MKNDTETIDPELETPEVETQEAPPANDSTPHAPEIQGCEYVVLKEIVYDAGTQPRASLDDEVVSEYAQTIKDAHKKSKEDGLSEEDYKNPFDDLREEDLPQIFRGPDGDILASGFHRAQGHKKAGLKDMYCAIRTGTLRDAILYSVSTNATHGQRRKNADMKRSVSMLTNDDEWSKWSDREIARRCNVSAPTVKQYRPAAKAPTVKKAIRAGKETVVDTTNIGKGKTPVVEDNTKPAKKPPTEDKQKQLDRNLGKIATNCGEEGGKFRAAVLDATLGHLNHKDVEDLASFAPAKQKQVLPLVMGGPRMKPAKAFDLIGSEISEKLQEELHNRAIASPGGKFVAEYDGFTITVECIAQK